MTWHARSPYWRVGLMCLLAFVVYGGWALAVNLGHGHAVALAAGLAQGISSTVSTLIIASAIEFCFHRLRDLPAGPWLAWLIPPTLTSLMHAGFQWAVGTPDILLTVLLSVVMGYLFAAAYLRGLLGLSRATAEPSPIARRRRGFFK